MNEIFKRQKEYKQGEKKYGDGGTVEYGHAPKVAEQAYMVKLFGNYIELDPMETIYKISLTHI